MNVLRSVFNRCGWLKRPWLNSTSITQGLRTLSLTVMMSVLLIGCVQTPEQPPAQPTEPSPIPRSVTLQVPSTNPNAPGRKVQKSLFHVVLKPDHLSTNGVKVPSLEALQKLLVQYNRPMITLSVHRCVDAERAKSFLNSIQSLTDTDIAYSAFGAYTDSECGEP